MIAYLQDRRLFIVVIKPYVYVCILVLIEVLVVWGIVIITQFLTYLQLWQINLGIRRLIGKNLHGYESKQTFWHICDKASNKCD